MGALHDCCEPCKDVRCVIVYLEQQEFCPVPARDVKRSGMTRHRPAIGVGRSTAWPLLLASNGASEIIYTSELLALCIHHTHAWPRSITFWRARAALISKRHLAIDY